MYGSQKRNLTDFGDLLAFPFSATMTLTCVALRDMSQLTDGLTQTLLHIRVSSRRTVITWFSSVVEGEACSDLLLK